MINLWNETQITEHSDNHGGLLKMVPVAVIIDIKRWSQVMFQRTLYEVFKCKMWGRDIDVCVMSSESYQCCCIPLYWESVIVSTYVSYAYNVYNKIDVERRNTLSCLDQYTSLSSKYTGGTVKSDLHRSFMSARLGVYVHISA